MGKPNSQPQSSINHCSHPHPLQISSPQPYQTQSLPPCSACKLTLSGSIYSCITCNYHLHHKCSQTPHQITHHFHQKHHLNLLLTPSYPNGFFNCDACGKQGNGFSYHCKACEIDLHSTCASMPLLVTSPYHNHQLSLIFSSPYPNKSFSCYICNNNGSNQWLYRCNVCGFDVHLTCTVTSPDQGPVMGTPSLTTPSLQNNGNFVGVNGFQEAMARNYVEEQTIMLQKLQNICNNASAHTNQDIYQAILGGMAGGAVGAGGGNPYLQSQASLGGISGGGGNPVLNALMGGNGGGSGGGNPVLNALMGGGGGGNPMLNALMGGGGGGNPALNALMGGGGGGGGNPVLNALMGGDVGGRGNDLLNAMGGGGGGGNDLLNAMGGGGGVSSLDFGALGGALGDLGGFGF